MKNPVTEPARSALDLRHVRARLEYLYELEPTDELTVELLAGGRSNLTFQLSSPTRTWILRRPPLGQRLDTAHDMSREVTVQRALAGSAVPVPRIVYFHDAKYPDEPYYVMDKIEGTVLRTDADFAAVHPDSRLALSNAYIDCLAALHTCDYRNLARTGFGRPDGFLERQVRRWSKQLAASASRDVRPVEELGRQLAARIPQRSASAIVHGDFRFDNAIVTLGERPAIGAVLDWEMSTIGDPLTDLGLVYLFWSGWAGIDNPIAGTPAAHPGYPTFDDLLERYCRATEFTVDSLTWYCAFAFYKMAVILEGINSRFNTGETVGDGFDTIGAMVWPLAERGLATLSRSASHL
ncbi:phosphotransferase family protein [Nocardia farcinica]|uniref:phosphotransferase family protein n=1 Tax=Nocardia farcinica TaxID=37329 RepID=UPI0015F04595|nr:phosphotransferase family protein [Nocardia farcinica]MBA4854152.1 phosphotransferase family protein [Nocardia farcinica]MBC9814337.1 phosphotransferase family protein [Nocardia farcinica]